MDKYLVLKGCAGLGNRLITLMKALQYAKLSGRKIYVDWADGMFGAVGTNVFEEYFFLRDAKHSSFEEVLDVFREGGTTFPSDWKESDFHKPIYPESSAPSSFMVYTPKIALNTRYKVLFSILPLHKISYILGLQSFQRPERMQGMTWWKMIRTMWRDDNMPLGSSLWPWLDAKIVFFADFRPLVAMSNFSKHIELKPFMQRVVEQKVREMQLDTAVGVHIRYTDKKPVIAIQSLIDKIDHLVRAKHRIFLCTDNKDIEEDFRCRYGSSLLTNEKEMPNVSGEGIHIWASFQDNPELKKRMFEDSLIDMWLLSKCKFLYWQGNSSFSYISSLLVKDRKSCADWTKL